MQPHINLLALFKVIYPCTVSLNEHAGEGAWAPDLTVAPSIYSCRGVPARPLCGNPAQASFGAWWAAFGVPVALAERPQGSRKLFSCWGQPTDV